MKKVALLFRNDTFTVSEKDQDFDFESSNLVLGFGSGHLVSNSDVYNTIYRKFPKAQIALCSTAGEIFGTEVLDDTISLVAIKWGSSIMQTSSVLIADYQNSFEAGKQLLLKMDQSALKLVFILSDGSHVNGSELVKGLNSVKAPHLLITGGLAGDGTHFEKTFVGLNEVPKTGNLIAIGLGGKNLEVTHGSLGGWESFGLERVVTRSKENILYEIDGKNALDLYKNYLGKYANDLPSSALLFPLSIILEKGTEPIVRTILAIDEEHQSMTFAGDIPEGCKVRFMKANFDKLIDAASDAASNSLELLSHKPALAFLVSCVGRKLILGSRIEEEVEAVQDIFGTDTVLTGFYSYGEISPLTPMGNCGLHNQTMTITGINEIE
ncbi:histidine kinase [Flavobacterium branchiophilum]|uniref:Histidine kinase n=1 Tax=Flavobacterium branchiophilum TaxID=55197 RepID=A0A543G0E6_9FLAO|nr:FIST N-terminal domain-containing protein [Flavobacterium branchiophilum]OXA76990.1 histidine kinase [Flavobacterium branchiophilum] [Flavobacterium branchiophilum NBRC 15030 = ATCC 35035]TQM39551.1 hypothetical protein BC670_0351 [Flavobacterium branchiophilum]GEM54078.1 hypothetical protein FB1_02990 [Flavobacterium branchiophilum NBRC 15030 = ATCC 35035]